VFERECGGPKFENWWKRACFFWIQKLVLRLCWREESFQILFLIKIFFQLSGSLFLFSFLIHRWLTYAATSYLKLNSFLSITSIRVYLRLFTQTNYYCLSKTHQLYLKVTPNISNFLFNLFEKIIRFFKYLILFLNILV